MLEKDIKGAFTLSDSDYANLLRKIGLDTRPGMNVTSVQICPNGRGVIYITLKDEIDAAKFIRYDVIDVTSAGVRAVNIKAAGKRDVIVTIRGLHPNTKEETVIDYLKLYGDLVSQKVVYGTFPEGPLKGLRNGDRSYKLEIKQGSHLGSYHVLDGQKITVRYPGQQQTCGRCLRPSMVCKGRGVAKRCEVEGGEKADFVDYILDMWSRVGYTPNSTDTSSLNDIPIQEASEDFTPVKINSSPEKFTGVSIKNLPKDTDHGEVVELLIQLGLPENKKDNVNVSDSGTVVIKSIENSICLKLINALHKKIHFSRKLFCNGVIPLTPEKQVSSDQNMRLSQISDQKVKSKTSENLTEKNSQNLVLPALDTSEQLNPPESLKVSTFQQGSSDSEWPSVPTLVRRHSLSLHNRSPNKGSIADEILNTNYSKASIQSAQLRTSIKDLADVLSDFKSCQSMSDSSSEETNEKIVNGARRKRGRKTSPKNNMLSKKVNMNLSPRQ